MDLTRRRFLQALGATAAAGLTACGNADEQTDSAAGPPSGSITVWSWHNPAAALTALVPEFRKQYPNVEVKVEDIGNPAIWDKITVAMAAGGQGLADVLHIGVDYLPNYIEKFPNGLADLAKLGANDHKNSFVASIWQTVSRGEKVYALPWEANASGFFYRADLFSQAGVDATALKTWDGVVEAGKQIKARTGIVSIAINKSASRADSANLFQLLLQLQDAFYFDIEGKIMLGSPQAVTALSIIKKFNDAGLIHDVSGSATAYDDALKAGLIAIAPDPAWYGGYLKSLAPDQTGKWKLGAMPPVTAGGLTAAIVNSTHLCVAGTSKNKRAAYTFAEFAMARPTSQVDIYRSTGVFPALLKAYDDPIFHEADPYFGGQRYAEVFIEELNARSAPTNYTSDYARALKLVDDAQTEVLLEGADPATVLRDAAKQLAKQTGRKLGDQ